jgi:hypothetical protein
LYHSHSELQMVDHLRSSSGFLVSDQPSCLRCPTFRNRPPAAATVELFCYKALGGHSSPFWVLIPHISSLGCGLPRSAASCCPTLPSFLSNWLLLYFAREASFEKSHPSLFYPVSISIYTRHAAPCGTLSLDIVTRSEPHHIPTNILLLLFNFNILLLFR